MAPSAASLDDRPLPQPTGGSNGSVPAAATAGQVPRAAPPLPPLEAVLTAALPTGPVGTLQQQADACMMLLRTDWKAAGAVDVVQPLCHAALHFIDVLAARSAELGVLKGTLFQALMAWHAAEAQRKREAEERRLALLEASSADADGATPTDGEAEVRATLRSSEGTRPELAPCLRSLEIAEIERLGSSGAELRALLRIKIEDDQDLATAQRALAECGYFLVGLRAAAPERGLSEAQLLKKLDLGEG